MFVRHIIIFWLSYDAAKMVIFMIFSVCEGFSILERSYLENKKCLWNVYHLDRVAAVRNYALKASFESQLILMYDFWLVENADFHYFCNENKKSENVNVWQTKRWIWNFFTIFRWLNLARHYLKHVRNELFGPAKRFFNETCFAERSDFLIFEDFFTMIRKRFRRSLPSHSSKL